MSCTTNQLNKIREIAEWQELPRQVVQLIMKWEKAEETVPGKSKEKGRLGISAAGVWCYETFKVVIS